MSDTMEKLVSLCKRKGFIFQSSEIYGGLNGCWDYGPLGVELLRNIKEAWWRAMTYRDDVEGIDASILMHPRVWEASGHVEGFNDPMVEDSKTNERFRLDHLLDEAGVDCGGSCRAECGTCGDRALGGDEEGVEAAATYLQRVWRRRTSITCGAGKRGQERRGRSVARGRNRVLEK